MSHLLRFLWGMENMDYYKKKTVLLLEYVVVLKNIKTQLISVFFIFCVEHYNLFAEID